MVQDVNKIIGLKILLVLSLAIFAFSLFKNIAYPLFWNDEGETVVFAQSVLRYGYPRVHNGKNVVNTDEVPDKSVGVKKNSDAWVLVGWLHYYFAFPFVYLAGFYDDLYFKTAIIRIPFALAGMLSVVVYLFLLSSLFPRREMKLLAMTLLMTLENLSVFLFLQSRSVRQHPLILCLCSLVLFIYISFRLTGRFRRLYYVLLPILLILVFNTISAVFFVLVFYIGLVETWYLTKDALGNRNQVLRLKNFIPLIIAGVISIPLIVYFEPFSLSKIYTAYYNFGFIGYMANLKKIVIFFLRYEYLLLILVLRSLALLKYHKLKSLLTFNQINIFKASNLLSVFFIIYLLAIARVPPAFERYFLSLQPVLAMVFILDGYFLFLSITNKINREMYIIYLFFGTFIMSVFRFDTLWRYYYEIFNRYRGPLDFSIPYIKNRFKNSQDLVIATNYEEYSYAYYLGSKVTVGFVGNNLEEDQEVQPDIIILRKGRPNNLEVLNDLRNKAEYQKISFPVYDYQFNNIPELSLALPHLFKTKYAQTDSEKLEIYLKQ